MLSVDSETTGIDLRHGALPFFVTTSDMEGNQEFWEWDVDPYTREPQLSLNDLHQIREILFGTAGSFGKITAKQRQQRKAAQQLVLHNSKFDVTAFAQIGIEPWPWERTHDTLVAAHILASNQPKDLTTLALIYLGINIQPFEDAIEVAVKAAKAIAPKDWRFAKEGDPTMPSAKEKRWKFDMWLPRAVADRKSVV